MAKSPKRIKVTDSDALLEHAKVLQFRSRCHDLIDQELRPAEQRVEEARLKLREAEVAAEQVKVALKAIGLQEQGAAVGLGDGALREGRASPYKGEESEGRPHKSLKSLLSYLAPMTEAISHPAPAFRCTHTSRKFAAR